MRRWASLPTAAAWVGFLLLYLPLVAVALYSFNAAEKGSTWTGFSLRWYAQLAADPEVSRRAWEIREAALNTLILGAASTAVSTVLGTLLALGIQRFPWPAPVARLFDAIVNVPVITPDIVVAAALVVGFNVMRFVFPGENPWLEPGIRQMILGHVTFQIAFVALVVRSRLVLIGPTMSEAARDLYATSWYHFRRVTLPLLWPAIAGGAMLAFTLSLDDFVISFFTCGPGSATLPIYVYNSQMRGLRTDLFAVSTLFVMGTVLLVVALERLTRWRRD